MPNVDDPQLPQPPADPPPPALAKRRRLPLLGCKRQARTPALSNHYNRQPRKATHGLSSVWLGAEYTPSEVQFLRAVSAYRTQHGGFMRVVDYLRVLKSLGYTQAEPQTDTSPAAA
jgi:hypothetical protein